MCYDSAIMRRFLVFFSLVMILTFMPKSDANCAFQAIFNFGDSNSDTGAFYSAFPSQPSPNGMTYFKRPTGRATDGRLYVDFLGQGNLPSSDIFGKALYTINIGQNDITGYLGSAGPGGVKQNTPQVISQITSTIKELDWLGGRTFLVINLAPVGCYPRFLAEQSNNLDLDESGCKISYNNAVNEYNNMLKDALQQTREDLSGANVIYVNTNAVLLNLYQNPKSHGMQHGITACCGQGGGAYNFNPQVFCGSSKEINGTDLGLDLRPGYKISDRANTWEKIFLHIFFFTLMGWGRAGLQPCPAPPCIRHGQTVTTTACGDPQNYVSWDGIHLTEAANKQMTYAILSGSYNDPPFSLNQYCDIQPIG